MRARLEYTEGYWWMRKSDHFFFQSAYLADGDSASNYELVTDAYKEEYEASQEEISDSEALNIITGQNDE